VLTEPRLEDAQDVFDRYASDPEVTRFLAWPRHQSVGDTAGFLGFSVSEWERWPAGPYLIRSRADGRLLGGTGLAFESPTAAATGYVFARDAWGLGYATEALTAVVDIARRLSVAHLYALCHPEHRASAHVLEKCGFVRDTAWSQPSVFPNLLPDVPQPVLRYEIRNLSPHERSAASCSSRRR